MNDAPPSISPWTAHDAAALYRRLSECPAPDPWDRDRAVEWWNIHLLDLQRAGSPGANGNGSEATALYTEESAEP